MRVTALSIYPVKACRGQPVSRALAEARGFAGDRRWMVVDDAGRFISQREVPALVQVRAALDDDVLVLEAPGHRPLRTPAAWTAGERVAVTIWSDACEAVVHEEASRWFAAVLGRSCRAVRMPDDVRRPVAAGASDIVGFADGFPYLLATEASLAELNRRLPAPISMERFRPNIVVDGELPFSEDAWTHLRIGSVRFRMTRGCDRCSVTTIDPATGEVGQEPLRTLATFRRRDGKVWFGVNLVPEGAGSLEVGAPVELDPSP